MYFCDIEQALPDVMVANNTFKNSQNSFFCKSLAATATTTINYYYANNFAEDIS